MDKRRRTEIISSKVNKIKIGWRKMKEKGQKVKRKQQQNANKSVVQQRGPNYTLYNTEKNNAKNNA